MLYFANRLIALQVVFMRAVAEVESENVRAGIEQG
jgi:hypothetical protein